MTIEIHFTLHVANGFHITIQVYLLEFIYKICYNYSYICMNKCNYSYTCTNTYNLFSRKW